MSHRPTPRRRGETLTLRPDGGLVVVGVTRGAMAGRVHVGGDDLFVAWLSAEGELERAFQFGTVGDERVGAAALDSEGNVFVAGATSGAFEGALGAGPQFVAKVAPAGEVAWVRQWHGGADAYPAVVAPDGTIYFTGYLWGRSSDLPTTR